jgi:hypothetical protein
MFIELNPGYYYSFTVTSVIAYAVVKKVNNSPYFLLVGIAAIYYGAKKFEPVSSKIK